MFSKITKITFYLTVGVIIFFSFAPALFAQEKSWVETVIGQPLIPTACTKSDPSADPNACGLNEIFQTIVNFSKLILALTGSLALLMFMYGGVLWIIAAGNQDLIQKGKTALAAAAIGLIVILSAWVIVNFTIFALTGGDVGEVKIFGQDWFKQQTITSGGGSDETSASQPSPDKNYFIKDQAMKAIDQATAEKLCIAHCTNYPGDFAFITEVSLVSGIDYTCSCYRSEP
ncbi:MAG: hypothetical protein A2729_01590 [Candidatus Buchananbacteria bacterium RIFCSPHIGHO2_01_FULL_39_14]|uniref:Uncharacterized protein n=2 Tax=Candidatus Buchananiibacteriota TaxID=1817903 RepID=A0A1G1YNZ7_9BACT|nr:MAG: hypothetical protein A2729_01590 [Candidatus Buchananbacteria bacterium RIFCSPHIGHO2_01_FULL_39_14]OGY48796.1 MAG: hypothetical protein A3D39_03260 [Candidatus Buchananbacteria bacterium RIFCSPHIGHO2_02_FULL_39_17]OGY54082.1 MAG: hypothetical protein A2912_01785 [Candidatus Buchananbacteria bacterium RIFCSPLOWO2_01_FULL_40_23b]